MVTRRRADRHSLRRRGRLPRGATRRYLQVTCRPPPCSTHLQPDPSALATQPQLDFCAHCGSQLHAGPPLADSSQYQPVGHMPFPHGLHVPSSQAARGGALSSSAAESSSEASSLGSAFAWSCAVAGLALSPAAPPPHALEAEISRLAHGPSQIPGRYIEEAATPSTYTSPRARATSVSWISRQPSPSASPVYASAGARPIFRLRRATFGRAAWSKFRAASCRGIDQGPSFGPSAR